MKKDELFAEVQQLLLSQRSGMLSTFMALEEDEEESKRSAVGFPFGSVVRYVLADDGAPLLLLSRIAEHSKHIASQSNVSLLVSGEATEGREGIETKNADIQQVARLTLLGDMQRLDAGSDYVENNAETYFTAFPESKDYFHMLDFDFYRLDVKKQRYIGGFAKAHWL